MKVLILYQTKKRCTRECAIELGNLIDNSCVQDVTKTKKLNIDDYSKIIIGTSIWGGRFHKRIKKFIEKNEEKLLQKDLGFFVCSGEMKEEFIKNNISPKLLAHAKHKYLVGGKLILKEYNFLMRFGLRKAAQVTEDCNTVDHNKIAELATHFN